MAVAIQARAGASRWCETAFAGPAAAETFLRVFRLHIPVPAPQPAGVLADSIRTLPWGLGRGPFRATRLPSPATTWPPSPPTGRRTEPPDFEAPHPASCLRVRHEDLVADPQRQASEVFTFLGLGTPARTTPGHSPVVTGPANADAGAPGPPMPTTQIPPPLLARVSELHGRLNYGRFALLALGT